MTTASTVSLILQCRSQGKNGALGGRVDGDGPAPEAVDDGVELVVGAWRVVVEEQDTASARLAGQSDGIVDGRVAHERAGRELGGRVLGVVDQEVNTFGQRDGGLVIGTEALGPGAVRDRAVVGEVGERRGAVADAVPKGAAALVRDLAGQHTEALDLVVALLHVAEAPAVAQLPGPDREVGWREGPPEQLFGVLTLLGQEQLDFALGPVPGREER